MCCMPNIKKPIEVKNELQFGRIKVIYGVCAVLLALTRIPDRPIFCVTLCKAHFMRAIRSATRFPYTCKPEKILIQIEGERERDTVTIPKPFLYRRTRFKFFGC